MGRSSDSRGSGRRGLLTSIPPALCLQPRKGERIFLWIYLPLHVFLLPFALSLLQLPFPNLTETDINALYYAVGLMLCLVFTWNFLRRSFDRFLDNWKTGLFMVFFGYCIILALSYLVNVIKVLLPDSFVNLNNEMVLDMAEEETAKTYGIAILAAPIVEELIFRVGMFGQLKRKNIVLAYIATLLFFAFYHVWQFILVYRDLRYLVIMLDYLPAGYALCRVYDQTDSIWPGIFLHMTINTIALLAI